ncbi:MAG: hypothetical protein R3B47_12430 [Bacteroidia bacterium]
MRVFLFLVVGAFCILTTPVFAQVNGEQALKNFEEEELGFLAGDEDLDALSMDLLAEDLDLFDQETVDLRKETAQAKLLKDHIQAEISVLNRENLLLQDQLERINADIDHYGGLLEDLSRDNERLIAENDALEADQRNLEEDDFQTIQQNNTMISENEERMISYDLLLNDLNFQTVELEDLIEENDETIERQMELMEVCEDIILTNEYLLQPSGK